MVSAVASAAPVTVAVLAVRWVSRPGETLGSEVVSSPSESEADGSTSLPAWIAMSGCRPPSSNPTSRASPWLGCTMRRLCLRPTGLGESRALPKPNKKGGVGVRSLGLCGARRGEFLGVVRHLDRSGRWTWREYDSKRLSYSYFALCGTLSTRLAGGGGGRRDRFFSAPSMAEPGRQEQGTEWEGEVDTQRRT